MFSKYEKHDGVGGGKSGFRNTGRTGGGVTERTQYSSKFMQKVSQTSTRMGAMTERETAATMSGFNPRDELRYQQLMSSGGAEISS